MIGGKWLKHGVSVWALLAAAMPAAPAHAQPREHRAPAPAEEFVRTLPRGYDAVVIVSGASRQRTGAAGRALAAVFEDSRSFPETKRAWGDLARTLEWDGEKAFDELLGRRVSLIVRGIDAPRPDWVIMTEVTTETERRLRERLKAAPRSSIAGLPVLSVEDGRYELVIARRLPTVDPALTGTAPPLSVVLLAPGGDSPLLSDLAPTIQARSGVADAAPVAGPSGRPSDVVVVLREPAGDGAAKFLCLAASGEDMGWDARLVCSPGMIWDRPKGPPIKPWSDGPFAAMEREALVAVMNIAGSAPMRGLGGLPMVPQILPALPAQLGEPAGRLVGVFVRPSRAGTSSLAAGREPLIADAHGAHAPGQGSRVGDSGLLSLTIAAQAGDSRSAAAEGDHFVAQLLGLLGSGDAGELSPAIRREAAVSETTLRSLPLDGSFPILAEYGRTLERAFGAEPLLTWGAGRSAAVAEGNARRESAAWWVVSVSPRGAATAAKDVALLSAAEVGKSKPRLSIGVIRPAAAAKWTESGQPMLDSLYPFRWIESLRWDAWLRPDGTIEAAVSVRMAKDRIP